MINGGKNLLVLCPIRSSPANYRSTTKNIRNPTNIKVHYDINPDTQSVGSMQQKWLVLHHIYKWQGKKQ